MGLLKKTLLVLFSMLLIFDLCLIVCVDTVNKTLLNPEFIEGELDKLGFYSKVRDEIVESIGDERFAGIIDKSISEGWVKQQTHNLLGNTFSYLNSETDTINLSVSLVEVKNNLVAEEALPSLFWDDIDERFPDNMDLSEFLGLGGAGVLTQLRLYLGYFRISFYALVSVAFIIILLIVLTARDLKTITIILGLSSLFCGILACGIPALVAAAASEQMRDMDAPDFLPADFLLVFLEDSMQPMKTHGLVFLAAGILLLVFFILLKALEGRREIRGEEETERLLRCEIEGNQ